MTLFIIGLIGELLLIAVGAALFIYLVKAIRNENRRKRINQKSKKTLDDIDGKYWGGFNGK